MVQTSFWFLLAGHEEKDCDTGMQQMWAWGQLHRVQGHLGERAKHNQSHRALTCLFSFFIRGASTEPWYNFSLN